MNKFRKLGYIDYKHGIEVHSSLLNVVLHDEPRILDLSMLNLPRGTVEKIRGSLDMSNSAQP
jgi:hypothetical protein